MKQQQQRGVYSRGTGDGWMEMHPVRGNVTFFIYLPLLFFFFWWSGRTHLPNKQAFRLFSLLYFSFWPGLLFALQRKKHKNIFADSTLIVVRLGGFEFVLFSASLARPEFAG